MENLNFCILETMSFGLVSGNQMVVDLLEYQVFGKLHLSFKNESGVFLSFFRKHGRFELF